MLSTISTTIFLDIAGGRRFEPFFSFLSFFAASTVHHQHGQLSVPYLLSLRAGIFKQFLNNLWGLGTE
jgi:hypothetical protein